MNRLGSPRGSIPDLRDDGSLPWGAWHCQEGNRGWLWPQASCPAKVSQRNYGCSSKKQKHFPIPGVSLLGNQSFSVLPSHYPVEFSVEQPFDL